MHFEPWYRWGDYALIREIIEDGRIPSLSRSMSGRECGVRTLQQQNVRERS
jgi:hypothetical protein